MTPFEDWRQIAGFDRYEVSSYGRVRNRQTGRVLKLTANSRGYLAVKLTRYGVGYSHHVHTLVAAAFICPRPDGMWINHRDGFKENNFAENLEYCSPGYNQVHAYVHGLKQYPKGDANGNATLTRGQVDEIRLLYSTGAWTQQALADRFGVTQAHISKIVRRAFWQTAA